MKITKEKYSELTELTVKIEQLQATNEKYKNALQKIVAGRFHFRDHGMMDFHKIALLALNGVD